MLQDLRAGKRTEIDAINGAIASHAERLGIHVPVTQTLAHLVRAMESVRR
jgi:2-dehydropantoate 2-reductase